MFIPPPLCTAGYNQLSSAAHHFLTAGLATSTIATYSAGKRRYLQFCGRAKVPATPASEATIILFVSHLATTNISHSSIKIYLSAVRHMHIIRGLHNEFNQLLTPHLHLTLKVLKEIEYPLTHPEQGFLSQSISYARYMPTSVQRHLPTPTPCFGQCAA